LKVRFLTILWTVCYGESNDPILKFFPSESNFDNFLKIAFRKIK